MKTDVKWAGLGLVLAALLLGCNAGTRTCVTTFKTCQTEEAGKPGYPCECTYPFGADAGIYAGGG